MPDASGPSYCGTVTLLLARYDFDIPSNKIYRPAMGGTRRSHYAVWTEAHGGPYAEPF